jgi:hypothetical protein
MKKADFWVAASCGLIKLTDVSEVLPASFIELMMEAASTYET